MKKMISIICVIIMVFSVCAVGMVGAGAVEAAKTEVSVKSGDTVTYTLTLGGIKEKVIGCDFSFYYDDDMFDLVSVADFNDKTDPDEWTPLINTELNGEIRGNWSILSGVDFSSDRHFLTMNLKATADGKTHLSYFLRYLYDNNIFNSTDKPQITEYKMTCDVLVNGQAVIEDAPPELNTEEPQRTGTFVNSVTGDSKDADPEIPGTVAKKSGNTGSSNNGSDNNGSSNGGSGNSGSSNNGSDNNGSSNNADGGTNTNSSNPASTSADAPESSDASSGISNKGESIEVNIKNNDNSSAAPAVDNGENKNGGSPALWIVIGAILLIGVGVILYYALKRKAEKTVRKEMAGGSSTNEKVLKDGPVKSEDDRNNSKPQ